MSRSMTRLTLLEEHGLEEATSAALTNSAFLGQALKDAEKAVRLDPCNPQASVH